MESRDRSLYRAIAPVSSRDEREDGSAVVLYQLGTKFVDNDYSIPEESKDVMYYALAVGHHTGVIDCFEERLRCPLAVFEQAVGMLGEEAARYKLEGIVRSGEIQIDKSHLPVLLPAVRTACCMPQAAGGGLRAASGELREACGNAQAEADGSEVSEAAAPAGKVEVPAKGACAEATDAEQWLLAFKEMLDRLAQDGAAYIMGRMRET